MFLIMFGAAVIPFLGRRFRLPSSALEIVFGFLLFNFLLEERPEWFPLFREIGLIYLMFIAGMELDLRDLWTSGRTFWYVLIAVLSFTVTPLLFLALGQSYFLGVAVAMISAGIVVPVLKESNLTRSPFGQILMGIALTGEFFSILVLTVIDAYHKHGLTLSAGLELANLTLLLGLAFIVLKFLYLIAWWNPERVEKVMESEDPVEEGIRVVVTVAFAGGLLAMAAGIEPILGSFLMGVVFSYVFRSKGRFEEKINALGFGFLIPFFFIGVGSELNLELFASGETVATALFFTGMILVSNLPPLLLVKPLGIRLREAVGIVLLLSAPLTMIVVAGTLGDRMGLISPQTNGALILTALIASILYPSLFRPLGKRLAQAPTD